MLQETLRDSRANLMPSAGVRAEILSTTELQNVLTHYSMVNARVAVDIQAMVFERHQAVGVPSTKDEIKAFAHELDTKATELMEAGLHRADFVTVVVPEGCEGAKENRKAQELGEGRSDLRVLDGAYGFGDTVSFKDRNCLLNKAESKIKVIIDPVEGTTKTTQNEDGAVAIIAGTLSGNIAPIPSEETSAKYADRIIANPRLKGKVGLTNTTDENIAAVMQEFEVSDPSQVEVVVMKRERNQKLIDDLQRIGVNLTMVDSGDLMPAIAVLTQDKPMLSMGSGGKQEAVIAAAAAKALGGAFELRYVDKDGKQSDEYPGILKLDEVITGDPSDCFVNFASITGVKALDILPPQDLGSHHVVPVATITGRRPGIQVNNLIVS